MNKIRLFDVVPSPSGLNDITYSFEVDGQEVAGVLMSRDQLYRYLTNKFGERLFLTYADGLSAQKIDFINQFADFISSRQHGINRSMRAWLDDYNPLHNFDRHEEVTTTATGGHSSTDTYNNVKDAFNYREEKDSFNYRDEKNVFSYAPEGEKTTTTHDNDKEEFTHTPTGYGTENSSVAFNNDTYNPLNKSVEVGTYKDSTVKSGSDSTTATGGHGNTLTGGHDSTRTGGHDSTKSGSVTSSFLYNEGGEKSSVESWLRGNIGTTKSTDMVFEELTLRKTMIGRELVADFVMDTTIF